MRLEVQSALIGAFVTVAVMTSVLLRRQRRRTDALFAILCVILVLWFLAVFMVGYAQDAPWHRAKVALGALVPAGVIRLFSDLVPWQSQRGRRLMNATYTLSGLFVVASVSPLGDFTVVHGIVALYILASVLTASRQLMDSGDVTRGTVEYARRRYLAIGASLVTTMAIAAEIPSLGGTAVASAHLGVMVYVYFLSQVITRERLLDLNEFVGRMLVLSILAVLFAAISAVLVSMGDTTSTQLFGAVIGVIILLTLYEPLKDRLEAKAIEFFFRERHRFIRILDELRRKMQHGVLDPAKMSRIVVGDLYDSRRATHVAIYLLEPRGEGFTLHASRGPEPARRVNANELPVLWKMIQQNRSPLLAERESQSSDLQDALRSVSADVLLPFVSGESVLGFLTARDDRTTEPFSTQELAGLMQIAETAATVIWNSRLAERVRERERLAAIGAMAAGLAHEIRNPLGAIKGAAEVLDPESLGKDTSEFLDVIVEETDRLNVVVSQFLDYARPFRAMMAPTNVNEVIRKTARLVETQNKDAPSGLELDLDENLPEVQADSEQLKQVVLNLVLNGIDATGQDGHPVRLRTIALPDHGRIEIRVIDRGSGIPTEDLDQIFIPFFTTKHHGTGLGLAVCYRIVENHGGTISAYSTVGEGTEFVIQLPIERSDFGSITGNHLSPRRPAPPMKRGSQPPNLSQP